MKTRQAKKILKASFTYWRYLSMKGRLQDFRPIPYWSCNFFNAPNWDAKAYKERLNPRFREALRVTRGFGRMVYRVAWGASICY